MGGGAQDGGRAIGDTDGQEDGLLKFAVSEVARLLASNGAMIYLVDEAAGELRFAHDAGIVDEEARQMIRDLRLPAGRGVFGSALARREVVCTGDYPADARFEHHEVADRIVARVGMRSMAAAPMLVNDQPLGVLGVFSSVPDAFDEQQRTLLRALAEHAAAAIGNLRLLAQLRASEEQLRLQAATLERTLHARRVIDEISRRIVDVADTSEVLQQVVDAATTLLGSDGGHLTLMNETRTDLVPMVAAGKTDPEVRAWLRSQRFPVDGGMNGLAATTAALVWTPDYIHESRIPHDPQDDSPVRLELGAMAVSPLFGPGGEVIGTLAITYREPRAIDPGDLSLLEELSRQASIAARNSKLYAKLRERTEALEQSERRYRQLVDNSPDLVWSADGERRLTYVGETLERLTGFKPETILGRRWTTLLAGDSRVVAERAWQRIRERPDGEQQFRVRIPRAGRGLMSAEINMIGVVVDGRFAGAHGSLRDITERERLEEDLRRRSAELAANEERANLARELHDSVTQAIFSMGLTLRTIELLLDRDPAAARAKLAELRELQNDALAEMRTLIFELRPHGLETDGLAQALRTHAAAVAGRTGLKVTVEVDFGERLPIEIEESLYRVAQEALHNVVKHAGARTARIALIRTDGGVVLTVDDDGAGIDSGRSSGDSLGLIGMRQRAERLGGSLEVFRRIEGGTRVEVTVPVNVGNGSAE